ncbi:MAG: chemotaxis protein CheW [Deltaproteobacteria bacterium]|nr:chemotaxis protein CheW [Deltaproteobacteria bacterium]
MPELRNVIVFTIGGVRYAIELRWVREVVSLGFVTGVPSAPSAFSGVVNLHGTILPVLDVAALLDQPAGHAARQGDGALVLETEGVVCAMRVDQIDHVASLHETGGAINDASGRPLTLLDPAVLVRRALELITMAAAGAVPVAAS